MGKKEKEIEARDAAIPATMHRAAEPINAQIVGFHMIIFHRLPTTIVIFQIL